MHTNGKMGVPKLFRTLTTKYPRVLFSTPSEKNGHAPIKHLFFDLNCLIHPVCAKSVGKASASSSDFFHVMFDDIAEYIRLVVAHVQPAQVYLFMDGVAPFAKILQQRQRRFKSVHVRAKKDAWAREIAGGREDAAADVGWDSNAISPDTPFMRALDTYLRRAFPTYVFSATEEPGEGEHKIVSYVLEHRLDSVCIYGLDADLILLGWTLCLQRGVRVCLVREILQFHARRSRPDDVFHYMSINALISAFVQDAFPKQPPRETRNALTDFVFLTFFLGNDFLPNLFGVSLHSKGLEVLLDTYRECCAASPGFRLVEATARGSCSPVLWGSVRALLDRLLDKEPRVLEQFMRAYLTHHPRAPEFDNELDRRLYEFEQVAEKRDPLGVNRPGWLEKYMERYFCMRAPYHPDALDDIVDHYLSGLEWNTKYYFKTHPLSFGYAYPYMYPPPLRYVCARLARLRERPLDATRYTRAPHAPEDPLHPQLALAMILPEESRGLYDHARIARPPPLVDAAKDITVCTDYRHYWNEGYAILDPLEWNMYAFTK